MRNVKIQAICLDGRSKKFPFHLQKLKMVEASHPGAGRLRWFTSREAVARALKTGGSKLENSDAYKTDSILVDAQGYDLIIDNGDLHIGCMEFRGINARKLRSWAEKWLSSSKRLATKRKRSSRTKRVS